MFRRSTFDAAELKSSQHHFQRGAYPSYPGVLVFRIARRDAQTDNVLALNHVRPLSLSRPHRQRHDNLNASGRKIQP